MRAFTADGIKIPPAFFMLSAVEWITSACRSQPIFFGTAALMIDLGDEEVQNLFHLVVFCDVCRCGLPATALVISDYVRVR